MTDIAQYNRQAWDRQVAAGNQWTRPVTKEQVDQARRGDWQIVLTPTRPVPRDWFGDLTGRQVLCLASGGGQQAPLLAAAGARVTVFDNSPAQLEQDAMVARRDGLEIRTVQGDMRDLGAFPDQSFDLIVNPCSIGFVPDPLPVWREAARVLRPEGRLMTGFTQPLYYLFDYWQMEQGELFVKYSVPWSDQRDLPAADLQKLKDADEPLEFGHTLADLIGGQLQYGLHIIGFYEDGWPDGPARVLSDRINCFAATLATRG